MFHEVRQKTAHAVQKPRVIPGLGLVRTVTPPYWRINGVAQMVPPPREIDGLLVTTVTPPIYYWS